MVHVPDRGVRPALAAALAALATLALAGQAQAQAPAGGPVPAAQTPSEIRDYWTPERMRNAVPIGEPFGGGADPKRAGRIASRVKHVRSYPQRTHGKAFLTMGGLDYVCSGTSVDAPSHSLVWTAGHCVYAPGVAGFGFATNFLFVPAYRKGHAPFGKWSMVGIESTQQWKNSNELCVPQVTVCGDLRFDEGAVTVERKHGHTLKRRVGSRGISFNSDPTQVYRAIGYPAEPPFSGERMFSCTSGMLGRDDSFDQPKPMKIACDMTGGSSGGGWVTNSGNVASVVSYGYNGAPNRLYGPYMANAAKGLYDEVKNGTSGRP